ncbi:MAG: hypothetical protein V1887_00755 [Candidatus Aenigmatarchaeota archaeon]
MKSRKEGHVLVVELEKRKLSKEIDDTIRHMEGQGIFNSPNILRYVYMGNTDIILEHGTDRHKERDFDFWAGTNPLSKEAVEVCRSCIKTHKFEDVAEASEWLHHYDKNGKPHFSKRLNIRCPSQDKTQLDNRYLNHWQCALYMRLSDGPRVFYGSEDAGRIPQESMLGSLSLLKYDERTNLLVYDRSKVEQFDCEKYIFREGVKPKEALKCVVSKY